MDAVRHADVFKNKGQWTVEVRTWYTGWTDVQTAHFLVWTDAIRWAATMVGI